MIALERSKQKKDKRIMERKTSTKRGHAQFLVEPHRAWKRRGKNEKGNIRTYRYGAAGKRHQA